jgi:hypothetical protein
MGMELILNLAWAALAAAMFLVWTCHGVRKGFSSRRQLAALAVLLLILFPVISVSDDLLALQNPAEADTSMRRDEVIMQPSQVTPAVAELPQPFSADLPFASLGSAMPGAAPANAGDEPSLPSRQNRPPPVA